MEDSRTAATNAPGQAGLRSGWLRAISIGAKLRIVTLVFAAALVLQFGAAMAALELSGATRAYVLGESLWSKAQKDGVIALRRYIRSGDPGAYASFRQRMEIILGIRSARLEMNKQEFDAAVADAGFRLGGVHSRRAREDMIWLYRCCHGVSFFAEAVSIWIEGDVLVDRLMRLGETARARIEAGTATPAFRDAVLTEVFETNNHLTELEREFSSVLTDGAEQVHRLLLIFIGGASGLLLLIAVLIALRITRLLREGTENLKQGIAQMKTGDLAAQIPVLSSDELGELAVTFNQLTAERKVATEAIRQRTRELERVNKELEQFAFATAHDLQTPLRGLVGYAQILQRDLKDRLEGSQLELLHGIVKGAMGMHRLVQSLLEYTRVSSQPNRHWSDLNLLLTEARDELQFQIKDRSAVIHSGVLPTLYVDARQIAQLLRTLIENAIKYQPGAAPQVWLRAERRAHEWVISVADAGIGIPREHHQRVFQIFQRLHTSEQYEGAGIGLTLAEKIVAGHGGRIWLESEPGKGSTFSFSIPDV